MLTRKKALAILTTAVVLGSLHGAASASAATEFGSTCTTNTAGPGVSIVQTVPATGSTLPLAAPTTGVIVKWKISLTPVEIALPHVLKVLRPGAPKQFQVVADSAPGTVVSGANSFDTRLPVQAGDLLGLYGLTSPPGTLACSAQPGAKSATITGNPPAGSTATTVEEVSEIGGGVAAVIEVDADGDGFGDETQDKCPQSAAFQAACPVAILDGFAVAGKNTVTVIVSTSIPTPVTVSGTAPLPKAPKGKAGSSAQVKLKAVTQTVTPGVIGRFKLKLPGKLKSAVAALAPGKTLTLKLTASATSVTGAVSKDELNLKLK